MKTFSIISQPTPFVNREPTSSVAAEASAGRFSRRSRAPARGSVQPSRASGGPIGREGNGSGRYRIESGVTTTETMGRSSAGDLPGSGEPRHPRSPEGAEAMQFGLTMIKRRRRLGWFTLVTMLLQKPI